MCGIFGYTGPREAQSLILGGLKRLEYRGYDSSGIAVQNGNASIAFRKTEGKIRKLEEILKAHPIKGRTAIGHTRWATHGVPNEKNAHPHLDRDDTIAVVHNGIIENFFDLKKTLEEAGFRFRSDTDTEVIVQLIAKHYKGNLENAVMAAMRLLRGTYAIAVISSREPGKIVAAKLDSPLVIGIGADENYLASDVSALLDHTKEVIYVNNHELVTLTGGAVRIFDTVTQKPVERKPEKISWTLEQAKKGGYEHFMLKEIFEQPDIVAAIFSERIKGSQIRFDELKIPAADFRKVKQIIIIGCGTAYHAGLTAKYIFEHYLRMPVWVDTASEFRYRDPQVTKDTLLIAVSQSGETADTLAGLREAKAKRGITLSICNVYGSTIAREARGVIYTHAGPEIAVASTKAYTAQLAVFYLLALYLSSVFKSQPPAKLKKSVQNLLTIPALMRHFLNDYKKDQKNWVSNSNEFRDNYHDQLAKYFDDPKKNKRAPNGCFLYLARNVNYPNALEGALKLKELSYISAEGYPAGEMKHGPIALIDENPWVICLAPESTTYDKMLSNMQEIRARNGIIIPIVTRGDREIQKLGPRYVIEIPAIPEIFSPLLTVLPLQLIAYHIARAFGEDIDQPRNLAKSVTVE
ncbi:MAG TPA: glutamine--fructose-6-phosphate transaminase (isomerizing) [Candidatus Eisenbacteria bacterium]|nr:glutamine--fructose-6-phosphate transaminase (isomerizing) [Candidatus Eisenbacteria bacterium]